MDRLRKGDDANQITENLLQCAELTDLCLRLRYAVLRQGYPDEEAERRLFSEIREAKERAWRKIPS